MNIFFLWVKHHRILFIFYSIMLCATFGICYDYINKEIHYDRSNVFPLYEGNSIGTGYELNTIFHYEKDSLPKVDDESKRQQMYGDYDNYFKISGGWYILVLKREGDVVFKYRISPFAAVTDYSNPVSIISETRDAVTDKYNCNDLHDDDISSIDGKKSKFHHFKRYDMDPSDDSAEIYWWNFHYGKGFVKNELVNQYRLIEDEDKIIFFQLKCYTIALLTYILIVLLINWIYRKCMALVRKLKGKIPIIQKHEKALDANDTEKLYQKLMLEIHPSNYFNPYNPEKVRIANDLLEALQNNRGNRTIIEMIREKAVSSLGIDSLKNDKHLLL